MTCPAFPLPIACWSITLMLAVPVHAQDRCRVGPAGADDFEYLTVKCRPEPVTPAERESVIRTLPVNGDVGVFTLRQRGKVKAAAALDILTPASLLTSRVAMSATLPEAGEDARAHPAARAALRYFTAMPRELPAFLRELRRVPVPAEARAVVLRQLPRYGELRPTSEEAEKLLGIERVSRLFAREGDFEVRLITAGGQAFVGLHERTVLVITREAMRLLSAEQLVAAVAHEIGHDYYWSEYETARRRRQSQLLQELELRCDGIAVMTLHHLGMDPQHLMSAVTRLTQYNQLIGATATATRYVPLNHRVRFIRAMSDLAAPPWHQMPWRSAANP